MVSCSIILPSRNGADTLPLVLAALAALERPVGGLEILLVDNASTDETAALMQQFAAGHPARVLAEPRPGKSFALNTAIEAASGDLLLFLDDDAVPVPSWATAYVDAAERQHHAGAFAGAVSPHWIAPPPGWLDQLARQGRACGCTPEGRTAGPVIAGDAKGANMAVRRSALGDTRFAIEGVNFGQSGAAAGGEDTLFAQALVDKGVALTFVPEARVGHVISEREMELGALLARQMRIGRGEFLVNGATGSGSWRAAAKVPAFTVLAALRLATGDRSKAATCILAAARNFGIVDQAMRGRRT